MYGNHFSPTVCVLETELRLLALGSKHAYLLSHLTDPNTTYLLKQVKIVDKQRAQWELLSLCGPLDLDLISGIHITGKGES